MDGLFTLMAIWSKWRNFRKTVSACVCVCACATRPVEHVHLERQQDDDTHTEICVTWAQGIARCTHKLQRNGQREMESADKHSLARTFGGKRGDDGDDDGDSAHAVQMHHGAHGSKLKSNACACAHVWFSATIQNADATDGEHMPSAGGCWFFWVRSHNARHTLHMHHICARDKRRSERAPTYSIWWRCVCVCVCMW